MASGRNSAEIYELESARSRLRANEIDAKNYATIGLYLQAVREAAGLSVADLSQRTHIKPGFINAIEQSIGKDMPARPFAIGFIRALADALGVDPDAAVERFKTEAGFAEPKAVPTAEPAARVQREETSLEHREMSLLAVLAVTAFIVWCAFAITSPRDGSVTRPVRLDGQTVDAPIRSDATPAAIEAGLAPAPSVEIIEPLVIYAVEPVYPFGCEAAAADEEFVTVVFNVSAAGRIANERVVNSSNACFDRAALNAIRQWRFKPRTVDGVARPAYEQTHQFTFRQA